MVEATELPLSCHGHRRGSEVVVAQSPVLFEVLEKMPLTELPKEKISAALIRVDERISQEVWRSILQFMYQGTISVEHCSYLKDAGKCVELLRACLLYKLPEPLLRLALSHLFRLLPSSSPTHALQVFALCASDEHIKNKELSSVRDGAAWVLLHQAHIMFVDIEAPDLCEILSKVVRCLESTVFENPDQPAVMEDLLSYSFHGVPQDILSQTLSTTRRVSAHFQTKEDMLSQSMASWYVAAGTSIVGALSQPRCGDVLNLWREARFVLDGGADSEVNFELYRNQLTWFEGLHQMLDAQPNING